MQPGNHVHVISGPYAGEAGIVLKVSSDNDQCIVISDATKQEVQTFGR
jgi:transcription antitermination factor NusG